MKVYISGKITGNDKYIEEFEKVSNMLSDKGYEVINPALVNRNLPKSTTYEEYMKMCYTMLEMADIIYFMKGYNDSKGAKLEKEYAFKNDITVTYEE